MVKVRIMGAGMGTKVPIGYGEGHYSCCPRWYGHEYGHFLQTWVGDGYYSTLPIGYPLPSLKLTLNHPSEKEKKKKGVTARV